MSNCVSDGCSSYLVFVFFVKQKTAYEVRISDWSSDVCSSDLCLGGEGCRHRYLVTGIQPATGDELALAATQIDMLAIDMLRPTMVVAIGEEQEEPQIGRAHV